MTNKINYETIAELINMENRVNIVIDICEREINNQEAFMQLAERHDRQSDWVKHFELRNAYKNIKNILTLNNLSKVIDVGE